MNSLLGFWRQLHQTASGKLIPLQHINHSELTSEYSVLGNVVKGIWCQFFKPSLSIIIPLSATSILKPSILEPIPFPPNSVSHQFGKIPKPTGCERSFSKDCQIALQSSCSDLHPHHHGMLSTRFPTASPTFIRHLFPVCQSDRKKTPTNLAPSFISFLLNYPFPWGFPFRHSLQI